MTERLTQTAYSREGEVLPYADIEGDLDSPLVTNESIAQGMANLENSERHDAELDAFEAEAKQERLRDKSPGVHVTLEQHRQDVLDLVDFVSGSMMRRGFNKGGVRSPAVQARYGAGLEGVSAAVHENLLKNIHEDLPRIYHADELIAAGFEEAEVTFDAKTTMRLEAERELGGSENTAKRAALRKKFKK